ncbi:MAG: RNA polymerase sigma-54 factor [Desulfobacteraceae bacterium IS3]|nr:MAG: RNA polymerase sigma-54 factor [Desulfobacteraceae bacterium IS3]
MSIEIKQQLKLSQQLIMTPQLQQAIKLLQMTRLELINMISQELEENPALEEVQEFAEEEHSPELPEIIPETVPAEKEVVIEEKIHDEIDWSNYIDEYNSPGKNLSFENEEKETLKFESFISHKESLSEHLLWQLLMTSPTEEEKKIGSLIIGNLNANGYLDISAEELAKTGEVSRKKVEKVLFLLKTFDPVGVCARDLKECLLIQARHFGVCNSVITEIIENHLNHLENKNYNAICKAMKADMNDVLLAVNVIKGLEPRPGRQFSDEELHYIEPDIYIYRVEDDFMIILNDDGMPRLRINSLYHDMTNKLREGGAAAKEYMQEKLRSATWLIKSIQQRQKTVYKVMESILKFQRDFFEKGLGYLRPLVLRDVAEDISMHESTISRVTTNKYVYTPQGLFELKYFFNSSVSCTDGGNAVAASTVHEKIRRIIESEDPGKPYSDDRIASLLEEMNISIARRTVAKYREMLRILPSNKRRQI